MKKTACSLNFLIFTPVIFVTITVFLNIHLQAAYSGKGERFKLPPDCYGFLLLKTNDLIILMHYDLGMVNHLTTSKMRTAGSLVNYFGHGCKCTGPTVLQNCIPWPSFRACKRRLNLGLFLEPVP